LPTSQHSYMACTSSGKLHALHGPAS